jgi:hypothetical protein
LLSAAPLTEGNEKARWHPRMSQLSPRCEFKLEDLRAWQRVEVLCRYCWDLTAIGLELAGIYGFFGFADLVLRSET